MNAIVVAIIVGVWVAAGVAFLVWYLIGTEPHDLK